MLPLFNCPSFLEKGGAVRIFKRCSLNVFIYNFMKLEPFNLHFS